MTDYASIARKVAPDCRNGVPPGVVELIHLRMKAGMTGDALGFGPDGHVIEKALNDGEEKSVTGKRKPSPKTEEDA